MNSQTAAPHRLPTKASTYNADQLSKLEEDSQLASDVHIVYAADHVVQVLNDNNIPYAIMGGFSLRLRGNPRNTFDVDLAVGTNMLKLRTVFASDPR
jgi:hypothetical protein